MFVKLSYSYTVGYGSGSDYDEVSVNNIEFKDLTDLEYQRLLKIPLIYRYDDPYEKQKQKTIIKLEPLPELQDRLSGLEDLISTDSIYEHIISSKEYYKEFELPKIKIENFIKKYSPSLAASRNINKKRQQFESDCLKLDFWSEQLAKFLADYVIQFENSLVVNRLLTDHPELCHMTWLCFFTGLEAYDQFDRLILAGRHVDEVDDWSEEWNLLLYLINLPVNPERIAMLKRLLEAGSNLSLILPSGMTVLQTAIELSVDQEYLKILRSVKIS